MSEHKVLKKNTFKKKINGEKELIESFFQSLEIAVAEMNRGVVHYGELHFKYKGAVISVGINLEELMG